MKRMRLGIVGESGSGLLSVGKILCEGLKNRGLHLNADREYPSLIKGGQSIFTINFSDEPLYALSDSLDILVSLDKKSAEKFFARLSGGGVWVHGYERLDGMKDLYEQAKKRNIEIVHLPIRETAHEMGGTSLVKNVVLIGMTWKVLGFDYENIKHEVEVKFGKKPKLLPVNLKCLQAGYDRVESLKSTLDVPTDPKNLIQQAQSKPRRILVDGNHALALGAVQAGVRAYFAYPMSPSSSILTHMANMAEHTGMIVKQAEDEITVANLTLGAYFSGTRSMCATSGGGFDLMTETVSLAGILENPWVGVIVQRPGPATGLPTWTGQGDLNLAIHSAHGEYAKIVLAASDSVDAYELVQRAHNSAEKYQVPVIILSEKVVAETLMTTDEFEQGSIPIERHLTDPKETKVDSHDRFKITENGMSPRWIPCSDNDAYYFANGDEHDAMGRITEESDIAGPMYEKRVKKLETIKSELPEPKIYGKKSAEISFVGWGSSRNIMRDIIQIAAEEGITVNYFHYEWLWPIKTNGFEQFILKNHNLHLIEGNNTGQLGDLLSAHAKYEGKELFRGKLLKWDGRPFFVEEVLEYVKTHTNG